MLQRDVFHCFYISSDPVYEMLPQRHLKLLTDVTCSTFSCGNHVFSHLSLEAPMTVKEVLQSLVDDNMVDCERVGTSNYYWAFPSKVLHARKRKLEELQQQVIDELVR